MRYISALLLVIAIPLAPLYAADGSNPGNGLTEDALINMKYDREFLFNNRDSFIKLYSDLPVTEIVVRGAKRSSTEMIIKSAGIKPGDPLSSFNPHLFINRLKGKNIFTEIEITYGKKESGVIIEIKVEEKWTLIPIPLFSSNRHGTSYGFFLMESNFMGYGKFLFAGGSLSSDSRTAMLGFIDPSIEGSRFRVNLFLSYKNEIYQAGDVDYNLYREYRGDKKTVRLDTGFNFTDNFRWFISGGYEQGEVDRGYDKSLDMPEDQKAWTAGSIARYESLVHYEYLFYGPKIELYCFRHIAAAKEYSGYTTSGYRFDYSFRLIGYNRFSILSNGGAGDRPSIFEETIGGRPGGRTLPADIITADNFINYTLAYEYPFLRFRWGAVTLLAFWEHGVYKNERTGDQGYYGPGAGTMVYLKRIALPAMGFNIARNLETGTDEFSVNVGMSF